jgi:hypothetical protein
MQERVRANTGRHESNCRVCAHPDRKQIEDEWCSWANTSQLAKDYGLSRDSLYRHARAMKLTDRRSRNLRSALERIIEQADSITVNAGAVVAAVQAYAKINAAGQWIERTEQVNLNAMFDKMSVAELDAYAKTGELPAWFTAITGATAEEGQGETRNG